MAYKWMPVISSEQCTGCGLCVDACGPRSLEMVNGIAALTQPETCGSEEHCVGVCRDDAIRMEWLPFVGDTGLGKWRESSLQIPASEAPRVDFSKYPKPLGCAD